MKPELQLAQINIARARFALDDPQMAGFVERLDEINQLAERSPGFVWRLQTAEGDATAIQAFDDPLVIVNMSVWRDLASLRDYVYGGEHLAMLRQKDSWFGKLATPRLALWWIPAGHPPSLAEGKAALGHLAQHGPTAQAFTFAHPFAPEALADNAADSAALV